MCTRGGQRGGQIGSLGLGIRDPHVGELVDRRVGGFWGGGSDWESASTTVAVAARMDPLPDMEKGRDILSRF